MHPGACCCSFFGCPETEGMIVHMPVKEYKCPQKVLRTQITARVQNFFSRTPLRTAERRLTRKPVIEGQPTPEFPRRPSAVFVHRQLDLERLGQMWRSDNPPLTFVKRLSYKPEMTLLQISKPTVQQFGRGGASGSHQPATLKQV